MRDFFRIFKVWLIILAVIVCSYFAVTISRDLTLPRHKDHSNADTDRRVFDYADKLTDRQEEKLEELISKREKQTGLTIVLVTLNENLDKWYKENEDGIIAEHNYDRDYYESEMSDGPSYKSICVWGNVFWDEHQFGFDGYDEDDYYSGDGVFFIDNWYNEKTWLGTSGDRDLINFYDYDEGLRSYHILDLVSDFVEFSPYLAYKMYINSVYNDSVGFLDFNTYVNPWFLLLCVVVATLIFWLAKKQVTKAKDTTLSNTYVNGTPVMNHQADMFISQHVTKRHIQSSSGGGGGHGGGHHGGGGHSHGGHGGGH